MNRREWLASAAISVGGMGWGSVRPEAPAIKSRIDDGAVNWPMFRGSGAKGVADGSTLPDQWKVLWKSHVPGLGHSSPIVWDNRIYVATAVSEAEEVPLKLGLFGDRDAAEENERQAWMVICFDKRTGDLIWQHTARSAVARTQRHLKATQANTTLSTDGKKMVAFFGSEGLYCYALDGELLWSKDLGTINVSKYGVGWGYASSPALHEDTIVLQCDAPDNPFLVAISLTNGDELWRVSRKGLCERSWATPYIHTNEGRTQVVANGWPFVVSYELHTGEELWRLKSGGDNPVPTPFSAHGLIYVANGHGAEAPVWAIRPDASGDISLAVGETANQYIVWSERRNGAYLVTPLVYRDCLYSSTNNGIVKCYDALSGQQHYQKRLGSGTNALSASPVAGDGKIYWTTEEGEVYVIEAGPKYHQRAVNHLEESAMATPAISDGVLYFRTRRSLIAVGAN